VSPIHIPGMHTEDTNRETDDGREFTCPNCGYQETEACVDERVQIGEEVSSLLSS
jgi:transcription elongation factor Elf1